MQAALIGGIFPGIATFIALQPLIRDTAEIGWAYPTVAAERLAA
jgi:hypothetical protein